MITPGVIGSTGEVGGCVKTVPLCFKNGSVRSEDFIVVGVDDDDIHGTGVLGVVGDECTGRR